MTISLFIPCFVDLMFPQVGISSVRIFEKLGHKVVVPKAPARTARRGRFCEALDMEITLRV